MDPSEFLKLTITNLTLTLNPSNPKPTSSPYCLIKLPGFPPQTAFIPLTTPPIFHLAKSHLTPKRRGFIFNINPRRSLTLALYVFTGKLLGKVSIALDKINGVFFDGWFHVGSGNGSKLRVCIRVEPDPRFVFEFDGEPECSPVVLQSSGSVRQPVFSCKFSLRSSNCVVGDRNNQRTRSLQSEQGSGRGWLSSFGSERERPGKERKGWSITVHDLSGSPVAAASMVTPFVASPGSDRVSKSNPGSWLILRPGEGTWNPWGRLEAWRERGTSDGVGYKFELIPDMSANSGVVLTETTLSTSKGGKFIIDLASPTLKTKFNNNGSSSSSSSSSISCGGSSKSGQRSSSAIGCSPRGGGSGDFGHGLWPFSAHRGFVMSANVGEGKCSKPTVEVSVQHVSCTEDAAAFVALAAAVDLSIDACKLFSQKLRKELCQNNDLGC